MRRVTIVRHWITVGCGSTAAALGPLVLAAALGTAIPAAAAPAPEPTEVTVTLLNGTTGEPGRAEAVILRETGSLPQTLARTENVEAEVVLPTVPIGRRDDYLVTAIHQGVPYHAEFRGEQLQREPAVLHVFDATDALDDVVVEGLNLIVRRRGSLYELEYLVIVRNETRPQVTVRPAPYTLEVRTAAGVANIEAELNRGLTPEPVEHGRLGERIALAAPLPPGRSRLVVRADLAVGNQTSLPVGFNLPLESWSVLAMPPTLELRGSGLESVDEGSTDDVERHVGPPLEAGQEYELVIQRDSPAAETVAIFADSVESADAPDPAPTAATPKSGGLSPVAVAIPVAVLAVVALLVLRRRRPED